MNSKLKEVKTEDELIKFLLEHSLEPESLDSESKYYIKQLCEKKNINKKVLKMHYEMPIKKELHKDSLNKGGTIGR